MCHLTLSIFIYYSYFFLLVLDDSPKFVLTVKHVVLVVLDYFILEPFVLFEHPRLGDWLGEIKLHEAELSDVLLTLLDELKDL